MNDCESALLSLIRDAAEGGFLRKLVFSQPFTAGDAARAEGRVCRHRDARVLRVESAYDGGRVSQKIISLPDIPVELAPFVGAYRQINLLTSAGDAELRTSRKGKRTLLGDGPLRRKMGDAAGAQRPLYETPLEREKHRILTGEEPFLRALGISDADGRVHDKRQAKFRQINRFTEYLADVYGDLPADGPLTVYDLCCGKSYLSFAVYHYLTALRGREVRMLCMDLKRDVMADCATIAGALGFDGMTFRAGNIRTDLPRAEQPDLVISLHACDTATDMVLHTAVRRGARVILSTPCCHRELSRRIACAPLSFVSDEPQLRGKLCEALTDGLRLLYLRASGYTAAATELVDPEDTPKNTLLRAVRRSCDPAADPVCLAARKRYEETLAFLLGAEGAAAWEADV